MMRFRLGLVIGAAVGYVLGARAGRQRYEEIKRWWAMLRKHPAIDQLTSQGHAVTNWGRTLVANGLDRSSERLRSGS
jgi:hypothetical protein